MKVFSTNKYEMHSNDHATYIHTCKNTYTLFKYVKWSFKKNGNEKIENESSKFQRQILLNITRKWVQYFNVVLPNMQTILIFIMPSSNFQN